MKTPFYKLIQADINEKFKNSNIVIWYDYKKNSYKNLSYMMSKESIRLPMKAVLLNSAIKYY